MAKPPNQADLTSNLDPGALRDVYDAQLRAWVNEHLPPGASVQSDGPVVRVAGLDGRGFVTYASLRGVDDLDALIARQRDYFAARGDSMEWKAHGHDPVDLPERLVRAGFRPEEQETVVIGLAAPLAAQAPPLPAGVRLREVTARADLERIAALETTVWGTDHSYRVDLLAAELAADPMGMTMVVAETEHADAAEVVCAGRVCFVRGTAFATLWGGSTLSQWRGRGIYRALVAYRAWLAVSRGFTYLQVDASEASRPILERLGFVAVTTTTPYVYNPSPA